MRLLVWQLVIIAMAIGIRGWSNKPWWRNRGTPPGSFGWWKKSRARGLWW